MRAEAAYMQGRFTDAHIALESAYARIEGNGQENMALCCDFLARRLSRMPVCSSAAASTSGMRRCCRRHNAAWINIWSATAAYYYALRGETERIPEIFAQHRLASLQILAPGRPMFEMIENQVYLAQGAYAKVIGAARSCWPCAKGCTMRWSRCTSASRPPWHMSGWESMRTPARGSQMRCGTPSRTGW